MDPAARGLYRSQAALGVREAGPSGQGAQYFLVQQCVACDGTTAMWAGLTGQIREGAAGLADQDVQRGQVPQRDLGFGRDVDRSLGHQAV